MWVTAATQLASAGMSVYQAVDARRKMQDAQRAAQDALVKARRTAEVNPYDEMSLPMQSQVNAREAALRATAQLTAAAAESERGAARAAGVTDAGLRQLDEQLRAETEVGLFNLQEKQAMQDVANQTRLFNIEEDIATGAQLAAAQADEQRAAALTQGLTSLGGAITDIDSMSRLYKRGALGRQIERGMAIDPTKFGASVSEDIRSQLLDLDDKGIVSLASELGVDATGLKSAIQNPAGGFSSYLTNLSQPLQQNIYSKFLTPGGNVYQASRGNFSNQYVADNPTVALMYQSLGQSATNQSSPTANLLTALQGYNP